jgi:hypothetical protein
MHADAARSSSLPLTHRAVCSVVTSHALSFCHLSCRESNWMGARVCSCARVNCAGDVRGVASRMPGCALMTGLHHPSATAAAPAVCARHHRSRSCTYYLAACVAHHVCVLTSSNDQKRWNSNCSLTCFFYRWLVSPPEVCACVLYTVHTLRTVEHVPLTHIPLLTCLVSRCPLMRSALYTGERRPKTDPHFDALGDIDELNSYLGTVRMVVTPRIPCTAPCLRFLHCRKRTTPP